MVMSRQFGMLELLRIRRNNLGVDHRFGLWYQTDNTVSIRPSKRNKVRLASTQMGEAIATTLQRRVQLLDIALVGEGVDRQHFLWVVRVGLVSFRLTRLALPSCRGKKRPTLVCSCGRYFTVSTSQVSTVQNSVCIYFSAYNKSSYGRGTCV